MQGVRVVAGACGHAEPTANSLMKRETLVWGDHGMRTNVAAGPGMAVPVVQLLPN